MPDDAAILSDLSDRIIGCAMTVANTLRAGFVEKVYENVLAHELRTAGLAVVQQQGIVVWYDGVIVGQDVVDLLVEDTVMVELKAVRGLDAVHRAQCLSYLKATGLQLCLLINFGARSLEVKRVVDGL
jgi:GxxExxY protein